MPAALMCLSDELHIVPCDKEEKQIVGPYCGQFGWTLMPTQLVAKAQVRKLEEELRSEKDMQASSALLALGLQTRWESRIIRWRLSVLFCKARRARAAAADETLSTCDKA